MPSIILPGKWARQQPTGRVELRDDGIASSIVAAVIPATGLTYSNTGTASELIGVRAGIAFKGDGTTLAGVPLNQTLGANISLFSAGRITRSAGTSVTAAICASTGNALFGAQFSTTVGSSGRILHRQVNAGSAAVLNFSAPQTNTFFDYASFGATSEDTGGNVALKTYWDGVIDLSSSPLLSGDNSVYDRLSINGWWQSSPSYAAAGNDLCIGIAFDRALEAAEFDALHDNQWQVFRAKPRVLYFDVGGGGGPTVIDLTAASFGFTANTLQNTLRGSFTAASQAFTAQDTQNRQTITPTAPSLTFTANAIQNRLTSTLTAATLSFTAQAINVIEGAATFVIDLTAATFAYTAQSVQLAQSMAMSAASLAMTAGSVAMTQAVSLTAATLTFLGKAVQNRLTIGLTAAALTFTAWTIDVTGAVASVVARTLMLLGVGS